MWQRAWDWVTELSLLAQLALGMVLLLVLLGLYARIESLSADIVRRVRGPAAQREPGRALWPAMLSLTGLLALAAWSYIAVQLGRNIAELPAAYRWTLTVWPFVAALCAFAGGRAWQRRQRHARRQANIGHYPLITSLRRLWRRGSAGPCVLCRAARNEMQATRVATVSVSEEPAADRRYALCKVCARAPRATLLQQLEELELSVDWTPQAPSPHPPEDLY